MSLTTGLVSYRKLDEGSGTTAFDSVGSNDGTISGATWTTGKINDGLDFGVGSSTNNVDIGHVYVGSPHSFSARFLPANTNDVQTVIGNWSSGASNHEALIDVSSKNLRYFLSFTDVTSASVTYSISTEMATGAFIHVAATYNGSTMTLYLNGSSVGTRAVSKTVLNSVTTYEIGRRNSVFCMDGKVDEVGIRSKALTSAEVTELYNSGAGLQYPFTVASTNNGNFFNFM